MEEKDKLVEQIKEDITSNEWVLNETLAIGICGSLAREEGFNERSDIDILVVVDDSKYHVNLSSQLYPLFREMLYKYRRDVSLFVYTPKLLKKVPSWQTLGMISETKLLYDRAGIRELFERIKKRAYEAGLEETKFHGQIIWRIKPPVKPGQVVKFELEE